MKKINKTDNKTDNKANNKTDNKAKKLVTQKEFAEILLNSESDSSELLKIYEISDFSESKTEKVENKKEVNCKFSTLYEFLKGKEKEFLKLVNKFDKKDLLFHYAMENKVNLLNVFTSEKFCSKEQIVENLKVINSLTIEDFTKRESIKEKTLNKFSANANLIFSISKNHIEKVMTDEDKAIYKIIALGNSLYILNEDSKKAKLLYSSVKETFRSQKNSHYMEVSNIVEILKEKFKSWKLELN